MVTPKTKTIDYCRACGYKTALRRYDANYSENAAKYLCDLCAHTATGNHLEEQTRYHASNYEILQAINYVGNALLEEIRKYGRP